MSEPLIDIRPDHWAIVADILRRHLPDREVWAFGSRATWNAKEYSDLDLAVIGETPLSLSVSAALADDFAESDLPFKVDVVDWVTTGESFRKIIERDKVVVQRAAKQPAGGVEGEWKPFRLGDVCTKIGSGATPRGGSEVYLPNGPYALIRSQNVYNNGFHSDGLALIGEKHATELENVEVLNGDVLLNITGDSVARACQVDPRVLPARVNQHVAIIRPDPDHLDPRFLRYFLVSPEMQTKLLSWAGSGGTRNALTKGMIESFDMLAPIDLTEQRAIAHILGTLDDKIELNRRLSETLEAMARALFKSWFVDFDPVRTKQPKNAEWVSPSGRNPPDKADGGLRGCAANPPYELPPHIADLFPARFVDSELGEIPEGWCVSRVEDVAERVAMGPFGASIKVETFVPDGVPIISGQHLRGFMLEDGMFNFITDEHAKRLANANVQRGDVVFTHAGSIGQASFIPETSRYERYVISQRQFYMRCDPSHVSPTFIALYFTSFEGRHRLLANTSSSGVPSIARPVTYLRTIPLTIPTRPLLGAFEGLVSPILVKVLKNRQISATLGALRDTLLPKLISGELRVKHAESMVERALG